jgi:hypothetical protein
VLAHNWSPIGIVLDNVWHRRRQAENFLLTRRNGVLDV